MSEFFANSDEHVPFILTEREAARYLRVDEGSPNDDATGKRMARLIQKGQLKTIVIQGQRRYARDECDRFVHEQMNTNIS